MKALFLFLQIRGLGMFAKEAAAQFSAAGGSGSTTDLGTAAAELGTTATELGTTTAAGVLNTTATAAATTTTVPSSASDTPIATPVHSVMTVLEPAVMMSPERKRPYSLDHSDSTLNFSDTELDDTPIHTTPKKSKSSSEPDAPPAPIPDLPRVNEDMVRLRVSFGCEMGVRISVVGRCC